MFKLSVTALLVFVAFQVFAGYQKDFKADMNAAKSITVQYADTKCTVAESLERLAGKKGTVEWSNMKVANSSHQNIAAVEVLVTGADSKGHSHTANIHFYLNHNTKTYSIDYVEIDGHGMGRLEGLQFIAKGTFS